MHRSRGRLTTKIRALVDADGRPIALKLTEGQARDGRNAKDMFDPVRETPVLLADCAYDSGERRETLAKRGAWANIKPLAERKTKLAFSAYLYRHTTSSSASSTSSALPRRRHALRLASR